MQPNETSPTADSHPSISTKGQSAGEYTGPLTYGNISTGSTLTPHKARAEWVCQTPHCNWRIQKGETYYREFRGGIDSIPRCAVCVEIAISKATKA